MAELLKWLIWILAGVGGIVLIGLLLGGGFLLRKFGRVKKFLSEFPGLDGGPTSKILENIPVPFVYWKSTADPDWESPEEADRHHEELVALQFVRVGFFRHSESEDVRALYLLASQRAVAWLTESTPNYTHDDGLEDCRIETTIASWTQEGIPITVTNTADSGFEILLPGEIRRSCPGYTAFQLCEELIQARAGKNLRDVKASDILPLLERAEEHRAFHFAADKEKQDEWRRYFSNESPENPDSCDAGVYPRTSFEMSLHDCLSACCMMSFARHEGLTADQWFKMGDRLLIVHDQVSSEVMGTLELEVDDESSGENPETPRREDTTFREAFEEMNRQSCTTAQWKRIGSVGEPIHAEVYLAS